MKYSFLSVFLFISVLVSAQGISKHITEFSQDDITNAVLVDVRTPEEFAKGHLDNAININWFDADFAQKFANIDKRKTLYVYCQKGGRSAKAQAKLLALGFNKVIDLAGGYGAWALSKE